MNLALALSIFICGAVVGVGLVIAASLLGAYLRERATLAAPPRLDDTQRPMLLTFTPSGEVRIRRLDRKEVN